MRYYLTIIISLFLILTACKPLDFFYDKTQKFNKYKKDLFNKTNAQDYVIVGNTTGYGNLRTDGIADFGLVLKGFKRSDLFQIEINDLMSTDFDTISIIGNKIDIPTNVALPKQKEKYIFSINLDKPQYQLKYTKEDFQQLVLIHGQFPFNDVVDGFRNDQSLFELADKFNMQSYSEYTFDNSKYFAKIKLDLAAGKNIYSDNITVDSPKQFDPKFKFVVVTLNNANGVYLANNLTVLPANRSKTLKVGSRNTDIFSGLIHETFADIENDNIEKYQMSFQLNNYGMWSSDLLGFITNLEYKSNILSFMPPANLGYNSLGYFYSVHKVGTSDPVYQNFGLNHWTSGLDLIEFENIRENEVQYRIDLYLFASLKAQLPRNLDELFEYSEFVTRNSLYL